MRRRDACGVRCAGGTQKSEANRANNVDDASTRTVRTSLTQAASLALSWWHTTTRCVLGCVEEKACQCCDLACVSVAEKRIHVIFKLCRGSCASTARASSRSHSAAHDPARDRGVTTGTLLAVADTCVDAGVPIVCVCVCVFVCLCVCVSLTTWRVAVSVHTDSRARRRLRPGPLRDAEHRHWHSCALHGWPHRHHGPPCFAPPRPCCH